jgi:hypothetical protein
MDSKIVGPGASQGIALMCEMITLELLICPRNCPVKAIDQLIGFFIKKDEM